MSLLIAGSIATDHLMTFAGKFADSLVVEQLDKLSVSFLVDDLEIRRGGVARQHVLRPRPARPAAGAGRLRPARTSPTTAPGWSGTASTATPCAISETHHTARFVCTTDTTGAQIASFYPGAMSEARLIELAPIVGRVGAPSYVLIGADDPDGDAPAHRGVPPARLPVHRRPQPAARLRRRAS